MNATAGCHRQASHARSNSLRDVVEAYGGLATVAQEAGITREALYQALSPTGNPTPKTLLAVLHAVGMRLSVAPADPIVSRA